jgi:hypothetical protein
MLDAISYRLDFMEAGPVNKAERPTSILNTINIWQLARKKQL